jgi:hypothetical protein
VSTAWQLNAMQRFDFHNLLLFFKFWKNVNASFSLCHHNIFPFDAHVSDRVAPEEIEERSKPV